MPARLVPDYRAGQADQIVSGPAILDFRPPLPKSRILVSEAIIWGLEGGRIAQWRTEREAGPRRDKENEFAP
jgi:hypothetical protein